MLDRLPTLFAKPQVLKVGDLSYDLHPLTFDDLAELQVWLDSQFKDPLEVVRADFAKAPDYYNPTRQEYMLKAAIEKAIVGPPKIGTPAADMLMLSPEGSARTIFLAIKKGLPEFTLDDARAIVSAVNAGVRNEVVSATNLDMVMHDPKVERPTGRRAGTTGSRRSRKATAKRSTSGA